MGYIETRQPKPNMNGEYYIALAPCTNGKITIYDLSRHLEPYNGFHRDQKINSATHEIHGKKLTVYIVDNHKLINRKQAIKLAERFIKGDFDTYRLD